CYCILSFVSSSTSPGGTCTLSLHDALPICATDAVHVLIGDVREVHVEDVAHAVDVDAAGGEVGGDEHRDAAVAETSEGALAASTDRKSTRLNSSHVKISYAVFCLKKKKKPE